MKKKLNEINKNKNLEIAHLKRINEDFKTMNEKTQDNDHVDVLLQNKNLLKKCRVNSLPNDICKGVVQCETNYREFEEFYTQLIEANRKE
jgi:hypothetical protein